MSQPLGLLADVVRFSWVDGPGNRFAVFLQGCNLDCLACHNPHTMPRARRAPARSPSASWSTRCARWRRSSPGVTISGGEATLQAAFVRAWFAALRDDPAHRRADPLRRQQRLRRRRRLGPAAARHRRRHARPQGPRPGVHRELTGLGNTPVLALPRPARGRGTGWPRCGCSSSPATTTPPTACAAPAPTSREHAPGVPVRVIGFRPHGVRAAARAIPEPSAERARGVRRLGARGPSAPTSSR